MTARATETTRSGKQLAVAAVLAALVFSALVAALAGPADASDQFTIDRTPDSFAPVVVDASGNGYVAWEHSGGGAAADAPMFCKLAAGARSCAHPIALSLPGAAAGGEANALAPFPILGPGATVWVVASRYVDSDTLVWTSSDGGATFGGAYKIPYVPVCEETTLCSFSYADLTNVDDMLPVTPAYETYDRQLYATSSGQPSVYWLESSNNPGLGFNLNDTAETSGGPEGASEFKFGNPGGGGVGGSALGTTASGDVVEAYWLDAKTPKLAYYVFDAHNPRPISPQAGWSAPTVIGDGYEPRLADGAAGLFMLSSDSIGGAEQPTAVDLRRYDEASHTFGPPSRLLVSPTGAGSLFAGGALGENQATGELAAAWPTFGSSSDRMGVRFSADAGARFTSTEDVATIGAGYANSDNARLAVAGDGTGFLTFQDAAGLQVADLYPLGTEYRVLRVHRGEIVLPVSCAAPHGRCAITASLSRPHVTASVGLAAGASGDVRIRLGTGAVALLAAHGGRLSAQLSITYRLPGDAPHTTRVNVTVSG